MSPRRQAVDDGLGVRFRLRGVDSVLDGENCIGSEDFESQSRYAFFAVGELA